METNLLMEPWIDPSFFGAEGKVELKENPVAGILPSNIIRISQPIQISFMWNDSGFLVPILAAASCQYRCRLFLELMGHGEVSSDPGPMSTTVTNDPVPLPPLFKYEPAPIIIPANTITEGVYRIVCSMTLQFPGPPIVGLPVAGFADFGLVEFYNA